MEPERSSTGSVLARSPRDLVFRQQCVVLAAVAVVLLFVFIVDAPGSGSRSLTFIAWAIAALTAITVASATIAWDRFDARWQLIIPMADVVAVDVLRIALPESGFGVIMAVPVIWMASTARGFGAWVGAIGPASVLIAQAAMEQAGWYRPIREASIPATVSVVLTLAAVSGVMAATARRLRAQRQLLRRQSTLLEDALQQAKTEERSIRSIMNAVSFCVVTYDGDANPTHANPATFKLLERIGLSPNTAVDALPFYDADGSERIPVELLPVQRALRGDAVDHEVHWLGHRNEPRVALDCTTRLILRADGQIDRVVLVLRDLTNDMAIERRRDDLVTSISHEFRTPLSSVLGYIDLALDGSIDAQTRANLEVVQRNAERMQALVADLLVSRSRDVIQTQPTDRVDIAQIVRESIESLAPVAAGRDVALHFDSNEPALATADPFRIRQAFDNLLSNAIKYNRPAGRVDISVTDADPIVVVIGDTGSGIPEAEVGRLFEPFFRAEGARRSSAVGTGLGLTICREIIEQHGGTIWIDSSEGTGTVITLSIPRAGSS